MEGEEVKTRRREVGKTISGSLYIHRSALKTLSRVQRRNIATARSLSKVASRKWNVVRISNDNVAFLNYPNFDSDPFPRLHHSVRLDLFDDHVSTRDYSSSSNPPILHRKELLVADDYPGRDVFLNLTHELEKLGVFYDTHVIGFAEQWESRLALHGIKVEGHSVSSTPSRENCLVVQRHKAALVRYQLSQPVQALLRSRLLDKSSTFFDFGCGRGDDVETLVRSNYKAKGWDPYFCPDVEKVAADVVNLGFVLNVIEDPEERREALRLAWGLTSRVLALSVITPNAAGRGYSRPYKDGFLTSIGTFQKAFSQEEIRELVLEETGQQPVPVAAGIHFVFADREAEQTYLLERTSSISDPIVFPVSQRVRTYKQPKPSKVEKLGPLLDVLEEEVHRHGRLIRENETPAELQDELRSYRVTLASALEILRDTRIDESELVRKFNKRKEDVQIYLARQLFEQTRKYRSLPPRLRNDIKIGWGSYANAENDARRLLFQIGEAEQIWRLCEEAADDGLGYIVQDHQFQFHSSVISRFPTLLRCYIACSTLLFGDTGFADLIKIHPFSAKLSLMSYDGFLSRLPILRKRIKINFRRQTVSIFEYGGEEKRYLYLKSLYIPRDFHEFEAQEAFDRKVLKLPGLDFSGHGPKAKLFDEILKDVGL